ncbi:AMP-binding protein [Rhodococcus hoagii]|nr:AMP-binding protein [Prescottella equi]
MAGEPDDLALRLLIFGGEALDVRRVSPWLDRHPTVRAVNMFGITETTVHATWTDIAPAEPADRSVIGVPLPGLQVDLLDRSLRPVPPGVVGEMYVGGPQVARGYVDDRDSPRGVSWPPRMEGSVTGPAISRVCATMEPTSTAAGRTTSCRCVGTGSNPARSCGHYEVPPASSMPQWQCAAGGWWPTSSARPVRSTASRTGRSSRPSGACCPTTWSPRPS